MSIIDELVTIIRFDMPSSSSKAFGVAEKGVSSLTRHIKDLGIVSMATGAVTAALSVNAAKNASELRKASEVTDLTTDRIQQLGYIYQSVGGDAKNATRDAQAFFSTFGRRMDDNALKDLQSYIAGLSEAESNLKLANAGFSEDMRRVLALGDEEFQKRSKYADQFHSLTREQIDTLTQLEIKFDSAYSRLGTVSKLFQEGISPALIEVFDSIESGLNRNDKAFQSWADSIGSKARSLIEGIRGSVEKLNSSLELERTPDAILRMQSKNESERKENLQRIKSDVFWKKAGNIFGLGISSFKSVFTDDTLSNAYSKYKYLNQSIEAPLKTAKHFDQIQSEGQDSFAIESLSEGIATRMLELADKYDIGNTTKETASYFLNAQKFSESIIGSGRLPEWLELSRELRDKAIMDVYSFGNNGINWGIESNPIVDPKELSLRKESISNGGQKYINPSITNSITIYGSVESDFTLERLQSAVTEATTDGMKIAYKQAVPDGFIGVH